MPVIEVKGDLRASDADVIAHSANCFCTFGAGIARAIKQKYPEAYAVDCATRSGDRDKLGHFSKAELPGITVYNLYSQYHYDSTTRQVHYEALYQSLRRMKQDLQTTDYQKLAIPFLSSGLAGGDWNIVKAMVESVFKTETIKAYYL